MLSVLKISSSETFIFEVYNTFFLKGKWVAIFFIVHVRCTVIEIMCHPGHFQMNTHQYILFAKWIFDIHFFETKRFVKKAMKSGINPSITTIITPSLVPDTYGYESETDVPLGASLLRKLLSFRAPPSRRKNTPSNRAHLSSQLNFRLSSNHLVTGHRSLHLLFCSSSLANCLSHHRRMAGVSFGSKV